MATPDRDSTPAGVPAERTSLAWLRTALAFVTGTLVLVRLVAADSPALAVACTALLLPLAVGVGLLSWRRHGRSAAAGTMPGSDALLPATITALAVLAGATGIGYVLST